MYRRSIPALFLAILAVVLFIAPQAFAIKTGAVAPDFELPTLEGEKVRLSDYRGQVILLKLATTWCPTCQEQTEEIEKAGEFLAEENVAFIEVFLQDSKKMVREYLEGQQYPMPFVALLDDGSALKAYNVYLIPRVLIIGPDFKVRKDGSLMSADELIKMVKKIEG